MINAASSILYTLLGLAALVIVYRLGFDAGRESWLVDGEDTGASDE